MFRHLVLMALVFAGVGRAHAEGPSQKRPPARVPSDDQKPENPNDCAVVTASAVYQGYGYTHLVTLRNGCSFDVECEVWTDVDPDPRYTLRAAPKGTDEVATRKGSPASDVRADKACRRR